MRRSLIIGSPFVTASTHVSPIMPHYYLGLDLGGTDIKAGLTDSHGKLLQQVTAPTGAKGPDLAPPRVIARMVDAARLVMKQAHIQSTKVVAVGVLSPGQASLKRGIVFRSANLPDWKNVPIRALISKALKIPAILENDANAAAYAEWWSGVGKNKKLENVFMFTLGTGVGGGLIYEGKVVRGSFDFATEIGHMIMVPGGDLCGCGQHGCLERYSSARYTGERASRLLEASADLRNSSSLGPLLNLHHALSAAEVAQHASAGDPFANEVWEESCRILALACINVCHFIDPQVIVLGGGMSKAGNFLLKNVQKHFHAHWWKMIKPTAKILLAKLGNNAGMIGAAGVAKHAHDHHALPPVGR